MTYTDEQRFLLFLLAGLNLTVAIVPLLLTRLKRSTTRVDWTQPLFLMTLAFVITYTIRPVYLLVYHEAAAADHNEPLSRISLRYDSVAQALLCGLLGHVCFLVGYYLAPRAFRAPARPTVTRWNSAAATAVVLIWIFTGAMAAYYVLSTIEADILSRFGRFRTALLGYGYVMLPADSAMVTSGLTVISYHVGGVRYAIPLIASILFSTVYHSLIGARTGTIISWLLAWTMHQKITGRKFHWFKSLVLITSVLYIVLSVAHLRNRSFTTIDGLLTTVSSFWGSRDVPSVAGSVLLDFAVIETFAFVLENSSDFPTLWGKSYLFLVTQMVPRTIWSDKPTAVEQEIGRAIWGNETGNPVGLIGELFMNFHIVGVVIGMILVGYGLQILYYRLVCQQGTASSMLLYLVVVVHASLSHARSIVGIGPILLVSVVSVYLVTRVAAASAKARTQSRARSQDFPSAALRIR